MIRPADVDSDVWAVLSAANEGDVGALRRLVRTNPELVRAEYWYTRPLQLAVVGSHLEAARFLLEAGADPGWIDLQGDSLVTTALDRGCIEIAELLKAGLASPDGTPVSSHAAEPMRQAAATGNLPRMASLLRADPDLIRCFDESGATILHHAVAAGAVASVEWLLDRGADIHAVHGHGAGTEAGYAPVGFQPIDLALWQGPYWIPRLREDLARLLVQRGANLDLVVACALGETRAVAAMLKADPSRIAEQRPSGKGALSTAIQFGHDDLARSLLAAGADPNAREGSIAPGGSSLYVAASRGQRELVEDLLKHGADPNASIESSGTATYAASTPELRALLMERGGVLTPADLIWLGEPRQALALVAADPASANAGCGGVLAVACKLEDHDLLEQLLAAGVRVPAALTACRSYLLTDPAMLRRLLSHGMDPDLPDWQRATPLHDLCARDSRGRPREHRVACAEVLLEAGADVSRRDEMYRSTPLGWAARSGLVDMVEWLLERGAPGNLPGDESWATPMAWARRRGHGEIVAVLKRHGVRA